MAHCQPASIYSCVACLTLIVVLYKMYENANSNIFTSIVNIFGGTYMHMCCYAMCGICIISCFSSIINDECYNDNTIAWFLACVCIMCNCCTIMNALSG